MGGFRGESREHHGRKFFAHFTRCTLSLPLEQPTDLFSPTTCRETEQRRVVSRGRKETGGEGKPSVSQNLSLLSKKQQVLHHGHKLFAHFCTKRHLLSAVHTKEQ